MFINSFKGEMKKSILLIVTLVFLNACAEYSSLIGPSYTMAKSGNALQAGSSLTASYGFKKITGQSVNTLVDSFVKVAKSEEEVRECQTFHTSSLSEIFFDTLDEIDCLRDPFSILK